MSIDGELIQTTPEHPFYTVEGEWVNAGDLEPGDWCFAGGSQWSDRVGWRFIARGGGIP